MTGEPQLAFVASTGRTGTMFLAATLNNLPGVAAFHEGHDADDPSLPKLPVINLQNGPAWHDPALAERTVAERRTQATLQAAADGVQLLVDVAFYNAPLLRHLAELHPSAKLLALFRRCESFVRSATVVTGEDLQPAGWPDPAKPLTDRERFIGLGRLRPAPESLAAEAWPQWTGIQRNIWLWHEVNSHLLSLVDELPNVIGVRFEQLSERPVDFWSTCLTALGIDDSPRRELCIARSDSPMNARSAYQVGPLATWSPAERFLHEHFALPLEEKIYA